MTIVTKIVSKTCICDPNPFGKFKNVLISLISNSSPIMYSPIKSDIKNWKFFMLRALTDDHPKKIRDIIKRNNVTMDIWNDFGTKICNLHAINSTLRKLRVTTWWS